MASKRELERIKEKINSEAYVNKAVDALAGQISEIFYEKEVLPSLAKVPSVTKPLPRCK